MRALRVRQLKKLLIKWLGTSPTQSVFRKFKKDFKSGNLESWQASKPQLEVHPANIFRHEGQSSSIKVKVVKESLISKVAKKIKRFFYRWIRKLFSIGRCVYCNKWTKDQGRFTDEPEDTTGYLDWCCHDCYEMLLEHL